MWNGIASKLDIIADDKLLADLTDLHYGYDLLERVMDILSEHAMMNNAETRPQVQAYLEDLLATDRKNIIQIITSPYPTAKNGLLDMTKIVTDEIDQEINKLDP